MNLAQRLIRVSKDVGWVEKAGRNKEQGYDFVRAVDIFDKVRDALIKQGVVWSFSTRDHKVTLIPREGRAPSYLHELTGEYAFVNADDPKEVMTGTVVGSTVATGDKGAWVAITGAMKYALIQALLLPTGDDPEAQEEGDAPAAPRPATAPQGAVQRTAATELATGLNEKQVAKLKASLKDRGFATVDDQRKLVLNLTGKHSSKQMSNGDLDKVLGFLTEHPNEDYESLLVRAIAGQGQ